MKNYLKITIAALFLSTTVAMANDNKVNEAKTFKMSMYFDSSSETIKTFFEKQKGDFLEIVVIDKKGHELSKSTFGKKSKVTRLNIDISSLPDGDYVLQVSNGNETIEKDIRVGTTPKVRSLKF